MIVVDAPADYSGISKLRHGVWCHMVSDTSEAELHAFAARLGLKHAWFRSHERGKASAGHYDLAPPRRALAVKLGAMQVSGRELVARNYGGLRQRGLRQ